MNQQLIRLEHLTAQLVDDCIQYGMLAQTYGRSEYNAGPGTRSAAMAEVGKRIDAIRTSIAETIHDLDVEREHLLSQSGQPRTEVDA
jgi:hypothetical protein